MTEDLFKSWTETTFPGKRSLKNAKNFPQNTIVDKYCDKEWLC